MIRYANYSLYEQNSYQALKDLGANGTFFLKLINGVNGTDWAIVSI